MPNQFATRILSGVLCVVGLVSLAQFRIISELTNVLRNQLEPGWAFGFVAFASDIRLPALLFALLLYGATRFMVARPATLRTAPWSPIVVASLSTIGASLLLGLLANPWIPHPQSINEWIVFCLTGPVAEELWFRGTIFCLAMRLIPSDKTGLPWFAIALSALLFSLSHLQYYGFRITYASAAQLGYTLLLGLSLGYTRAATGRLGYAIGLHIITNVSSQIF
ncbi:MAG: CPBP family intramembrane metalloprotease [Chloroflexi bacterium]|nr:CPBP family intramembrane metalloprotease [Chloroflexota bacterium]